jgi:hypothetical protein
LQLQSRASNQTAYFDGDKVGDALSIFFSQNAECVGRWRLTIKAITSQSSMIVGVLFVSPPSATNPHGMTSRMVGAAIVPGVVGWEVDCICVGGGEGGSVPDESANVMLLSSQCCTAPVGVSRVGERYFYATGPGASYVVQPGQRVKSWTVSAAAAVGSVSINGASAIVVPANTTLVGRPESSLPMIESFAFTGVGLNWFIELLESA